MPTEAPYISMRGIPVQYAVPRRQILLIVGGVVLLIGGITALALTLRSGETAAGLALACTALFIWWLIRNVNGDGEASLDEGALEIVPRRFSFCAGRGPVRIDWCDIDRVQVGATAAPNAPRPYVILRVRKPRRSWIIMARRPEDGEFSRRVIESINAARIRDGKLPLEIHNPNYSPWAKAAVLLCLLSVASGILGTFASGKITDPSVWCRVLLLGAIAFPLVQQVFGARPKR